MSAIIVEPLDFSERAATARPRLGAVVSNVDIEKTTGKIQ